MSTQIPTPSGFPMKPPGVPKPEIEEIDDKQGVHISEDEQPEIGEPADDFPNR